MIYSGSCYGGDKDDSDASALINLDRRIDYAARSFPPGSLVLSIVFYDSDEF